MEDDDVKASLQKQLETVNKLKQLKDTIRTMQENPETAGRLKLSFKHNKQLTLPFFVEAAPSLLALVDDLIQKHYNEGIASMQKMQREFQEAYGEDMKDIHLAKEQRDWLGIK